MKQTLKKLCVSLLTLLAVTSNAQTYCSTSPANCELVCNGGFETVTGYPPDISTTLYGQYLPLATGWSITAGTPDLYHVLGGTTVSIPCNSIGYQYAHSGSAYIGLVTDGAIDVLHPHGYYEGVSTNFSSMMITNKIYDVNFWVSKADLSNVNNKDLVVAFTAGGNATATYTVPAIKLNDATNWVNINFSYCSLGAEDGMQIYADNFSAYTTAPTYTTAGCSYTAQSGAAYLYIDDVSVKEAKFSITNNTTACINTLNTFNLNSLCGVNNANYNFSWNFGDGTAVVNTGSLTTTTHSYTAFGSYTGTVTVTGASAGVVYSNYIPSCSMQYTFSVNVPSMSVAVTTNTNTICNAVTNFTATPSPSGSYTYSWAVYDAATGTVVAAPITNGSTAFPSIDFTGIYQNANVCATITNTLGCSTTKCYYIPSCCQTGFKVVKYANYTFTVNTTVSSANVAFGGTITINPGITLQLVNTNAKLDPNTKFVLVGNASTFYSSGSYIHGCNAMWDGIYPLSTGNVVITNSRVEDAQRVVIDSLGGASITLTNNYINKNYMGVNFKANKTSTSTVTLKNNLFTCSNIALAGLPYVTTVPNLTNANSLGANASVYLLPPYSTKKSYAGVVFSNASQTGATNTAITIGGNAGEENVFDKMQWGTYSFSSRTAFQNNVFQNIKATIAPGGGTNAAILALGPIFGTGSPGYMTVGGINSGFKNTFTNNDYGVYNVSQSTLLITYNRFDTQTTGIYVTSNNNNSSVSTSQNKFVNNTIGINYDQNTLINATIMENWFDNTTALGSAATNFAIRTTEAVLATNPNSYPSYLVINNYINGYYNGVFASNTLQESIRDNEVHMRPDNGYGNSQAGVNLVITNNNDVYNNLVDMPSTNPLNWWQYGIATGLSTVPKIHCNNTSYLGTGILANGLNYTTAGNGFYGNSMTNAAYGFWLNANGEIGNQFYAVGTSSYSADNSWTGCTNETYVGAGCNTIAAKFYTRASGIYNIVNASSGSSAPLLSGIVSTGFTGTCYGGISTPTLNLRLSGASAQAALMQQADNIASGTLTFASNNISLKQIARKQLYSNIALQQIDPAVTANINAFVNSSKHQPLGKFFVVDSLINTCDSSQLTIASTINNNINATNDVDMTQQQFNNLYLSYLTNKRKTTVADVLALETIAYLCPNAFGHAVHQARGLLFNITHKQYTNVCETTSPSSSRMAEQQANGTVTNIKLYPNPSSGNITIETADDLSYNLTVYNVLGEKVVDLTVSNKQTINLSSLPSATYVVLINYNGSLVKTERISIIH